MKKSRIRYSELKPGVAAEMVNPPVERVAEAEVVIAPVGRVAGLERSPRGSTPVELARALTAARNTPVLNTAVSLAADGAGVIAQSSLLEESGSPPVVADDAQGPLAGESKRAEDRAELMMFDVGGERFAIELSSVEEVVDEPAITFVPEMPASMVGVVSVRGAFTAVYSPASCLGVSLGVRRAVLVFRHRVKNIGILIDDVRDALTLHRCDIRESPARDNDGSPVVGVIQHENALISVLDARVLIMGCIGIGEAVIA